jgi:urease accessory protein UreF
MELFADLCAYTALAQAEPDALPALLTLPRALCAVAPEALPLSSLAAFETHYGGEALDLATYLWYHGRLFRLAEQLHRAQGEGALQQLWAVFVVPHVSDVDDAGLAALLAQVSPLLAAAVRTWPALPREGL